MTRVNPEEASARRHRTGQDFGFTRRVENFNLGLENVAGPSFGVEEAALAAFLELASRVGDEDVARVGGGQRVVTPDLVEETLAGDDQALVAHQELEQLELPVGQLDLAL